MKPTTKNQSQESTMKKSIVVLALVIVSFALIQNAAAQTTNNASQSVSLTVAKVYRIGITGGALSMTINDGLAGTNALTSATDNTSTYAITQNSLATPKITANLDAAMTKGKLSIQLAAGLGASAGLVEITNATAASAVNVVTNMGAGAKTGQSIGYTFTANASEGTFTDSKTVTLTIVD
jgi:hypothetical protein